MFFVFRIHFHYVLSYLFDLFGVRTCVSILWHTSLPKMQLLLEKIAKNHDFGDFWWFSCFWHDVTYDVTVTSYKVCLYLFWYQWTREGHSYPLVPHTWCFVNRFPRSWGGGIRPLPSGCEMGPKSPALLGLNGCTIIEFCNSRNGTQRNQYEAGYQHFQPPLTFFYLVQLLKYNMLLNIAYWLVLESILKKQLISPWPTLLLLEL